MTSSTFITGPITEYTLGDIVRLYTPTPFLDEDGAPADPDALQVTVWPFTESEDFPQIFELGVDAELAKVGTDAGMYRFDFQPPTTGMWLYRWYAIGDVTAALEGRFLVTSRERKSLTESS